MRIRNLTLDHADDAARILVAAFREISPAWPTFERAREEVLEAIGGERIARAAWDDRHAMAGWIGAIPEYGGLTWELHPLAVDPAAQGRGVGRALVADLEREVLRAGGGTLFLGTDDENNQTSLGGTDVWPDPLSHLVALVPGKHPSGFYRRLGFAVVGIIPDANGPGKPDILMAKRLAKGTISSDR